MKGKQLDVKSLLACSFVSWWESTWYEPIVTIEWNFSLMNTSIQIEIRLHIMIWYKCSNEWDDDDKSYMIGEVNKWNTWKTVDYGNWSKLVTSNISSMCFKACNLGPLMTTTVVCQHNWQHGDYFTNNCRTCTLTNLILYECMYSQTK